jgi:hypothetical protein
MNGGMPGFAQFGHVLNYMEDCEQDYSNLQGTDYEVMNGTLNLYAIHPVTALSFLSNHMMMEYQCQSDVQQHAFTTCAPIAYARCNSSFTNPGLTANSSYWSDEFTPIKAGMDCIMDAAFNSTGFGQNQEMPCFTWLKKTPYYMCYNDVTSSMCSGDLSDQINCLVNSIQGGMIMGECSTALGNYPSNFMSLNSSDLLQYQEAFYGLVANPVGDPFATPSPAPTMDSTPAPTVDQGSGMMNNPGGGPSDPIIILIVILIAAAIGAAAFIWHRKKRNAPDNQCFQRKSGHTFDEAAATTNGQTATTNAPDKMNEVEIR